MQEKGGLALSVSFCQMSQPRLSRGIQGKCSKHLERKMIFYTEKQLKKSKDEQISVDTMLNCSK
jgi:hypothetical protein